MSEGFDVVSSNVSPTNRNIPDVTNKTSQKSKFLRTLGLPLDILKYLENISLDIKYKYLDLSKFSLRNIKKLKNKEINAVENLMRENLQNNRLNILNQEKITESGSIIFSNQIDSKIVENEVNRRIFELNEFKYEALMLFGDDPKFFVMINNKINEIDQVYSQMQANIQDLKQLDTLETQVIKLKNEIKSDIEEHCKNLQKQQSLGLRTVTNLLKGFRTKKMLHSTSNTHAMLKDLKKSVQAVADTRYQFIVEPDLRKEAFKNVKFIQERTEEIAQIERSIHAGFFSKIVRHINLKKIDRDVQEIKKIADNYYNELNFTDDEVAKFQNLSLEAHRPTRQHLLNYANDVLDGAKNLASKEKLEVKRKIIRKYISKTVSPDLKKVLKREISTLSNYFILQDKKDRLKAEKERLEGMNGQDFAHVKKLIKNLDKQIARYEAKIAAIHSKAEKEKEFEAILEHYHKFVNSEEHFKTLTTMIGDSFPDTRFSKTIGKLVKRVEKYEAFEKQIEALRELAQQNPVLGANNPAEALSMDSAVWKQQQLEAKNAIQEIFNTLKKTHVQVKHKHVTALRLRKSGSALNHSRNRILQNKLRWDRPIKRIIEFPGGIGGAFTEQGQMHATHTMTCPNRGYPSSAPRTRTAGIDCIQSNLQRVDITSSTGTSLASYTSSATNVEFFQQDPSLRSQATLHQTGEILLGKIDHKLASLNPEDLSDEDLKHYQAGQLGTAEHPITVDVMTVLLLSPDSLRSWLLEHPKINRFVGRFNHAWHVDPSTHESQMLNESIQAWQAFDKSNPQGMEPTKTFVFKSKAGGFRKLVGEVVNGERRFYVVPCLDESGKEASVAVKVYIKFDVSTYNTGCNKWTQMMRNFKNGVSLETLAKKWIDRIPGLRGTYSGALGQKVEDDLNREAFAKDRVRFDNKMNRMERTKQEIFPKAKPNTVLNIEKLIYSENPEQPGTRELRHDFHLAEQRYYAALNDPKRKKEVKALRLARDGTFQAWQSGRQKVASELAKALTERDIDSATKRYLELAQHQENLVDIYNEVSDLFEFEHYKTEAGMKSNMYMLSSALVAFGIELNADPHTGCRSGKDRTSLQRMEVGTRVLTKESYGRYLNYREMDHSEIVHETREQMLLNSGHIDSLSYLNTGSAGLNLSGGYGTYLKNFGEGGKIYPSWYENIILYGTKNVFAMKLK